jgi:hypothetical protein
MLVSPSDEDDEASRSRAVWGLVALAIIAVLVVAVMIITTGSTGKHRGQTFLPPPSTPFSPPTTPTAAVSTPASTAFTSGSASSAIPTSTASPCPSVPQCAVPGDAGRLAAAVNRFRTSHSRSAVAAAVSPKAQQCALSQGDGPACEPSFAWEPVPTQDGAKAVALVTGRGDGVQWLLDPGMKAFSVGWAYASGRYECAILKAS